MYEYVVCTCGLDGIVISFSYKIGGIFVLLVRVASSGTEQLKPDSGVSPTY